MNHSSPPKQIEHWASIGLLQGYVAMKQLQASSCEIIVSAPGREQLKKFFSHGVEKNYSYNVSIGSILGGCK